MTTPKNRVPEAVQQLVTEAGGAIDYVSGPLPDGSSFCTASFPLPVGHWLTAEGHNEPPVPMRLGTDDPQRKVWEQSLRAAGRYAIRAATRNGQDLDFDPDALIQNLIVGMLGHSRVVR